MGCPEVIITDQGREFVNALSTQLYAITHRASNHKCLPSPNKWAHRALQTLTRCMVKVVNESQSDWDEKIDRADGVQSLSTGVDKEITLHALPARYAASN